MFLPKKAPANVNLSTASNCFSQTVWDQAPIVNGLHQSQCISIVTGGDTVYKRYES